MTPAGDAGLPATRSHGWPHAVLFDLDGTLVDTGPDIAAAVNRMLGEMGRREYPLARILEWVGDGAARLVHRALTDSLDGQAPAAEYEHGMTLFYDHYAEGICRDSKPYPHARDLLERLESSLIRVGCVTNKPEHLTRMLIDRLGLTALFGVIVGGDTLEARKPNPEPLHHACRQLGVRETDTVYVGDSMTDCRAAEAAGVAMIAVSYGYHRNADLTRAPSAAIIDSLEQVPETLKRI